MPPSLSVSRDLNQWTRSWWSPLLRLVMVCSTWANTVYVDWAENIGLRSKMRRALTLSFL